MQGLTKFHKILEEPREVSKTNEETHYSNELTEQKKIQ